MKDALRRRARLGALLPLLLAACTSLESADVATEPAPAPVSAEVAQATFDDVWSTVREHHFDEKLNGLDWDAVRDELRPRASEAATQAELRGVVNEMLGRLEQSHFGMMPRSNLPALDGSDDAETPDSLAGDLGLDVRARGGDVLVWKVTPGGPADAAGIRPGWILLRVDDLDVDAYFDEAASVEDERAARYATFQVHSRVMAETYGPIGSTAQVTLLDDGDREVVVEVTRGERDVEKHNFGTNLPTFYLHFDKATIERDGAKIGWIHWSNWFLPVMKPIDQAVDEMRSHDGIVLDLRGNGGGAGAMVMGVAGHFFDERTDLGTQSSREGNMVYRASPRRISPAGERVGPYSGKVAILVDELTGSASEVFSGGMQSTGRVRVFGETSAGAVLPAVTKTLPNGDGLLYAFGDFKTSTGTLLEGLGVVPDVEVPLTRDSLLAGKDAALEAAIAWITGRELD
ncbi:MAG: S41 family peptidase [Planctomycetota bacterium]